MPFKTPTYPKTLTNKDWQKKKGLIAKIVGKSGVGATLDAAEKAHAAVVWKKLDIGLSSPQGNRKTREALKQTLDAAVAEFQTAVEGKLRPRLQEARKIAQKTVGDWEKNKKIPKKAVEAAKEVAKQADFFMVAVNKNTILSKVMQDYQNNMKGIETREKIIAENAKRLRSYCNAVATGIKTIKTKAAFNGKFWDENIRGVGTALPLVSKDLGILAEHKQWRVFASEKFKAKTDEEVPAKLKQMAPILKKIQEAAQTI